MTRPHETHFDDCGCLSERHAQQIADANAAIKRLTRERDEALAAHAAEGRRKLEAEARERELREAGERLQYWATPMGNLDPIARDEQLSAARRGMAAALSRPPGGSEALRAWTERAARLAVECFERNECDFVCMGGNCLSTDPERVKACLAKDRDAFFAAIVARLLGPQATEEGGAK